MGILSLNRRQTVRAPTNPMDKSTVISIYPRQIVEVKPTIQPGKFIIPAGSFEAPGMLAVTSSSWWREIDEEQPLLEIPNSSIQVADSIVKDWCNGLLACNMNDVMPGITYLPGDISRGELKTKYLHVLVKLRDNQNRWYAALVKLADTSWAKSNGNPLSISEDMRSAARELNLTNKEWMVDFTQMEMIRCIACGSMRNPAFPICQSCHAIIDKDKAKELGLTFAQ